MRSHGHTIDSIGISLQEATHAVVLLRARFMELDAEIASLKNRGGALEPLTENPAVENRLTPKPTKSARA